MHSLPFITTSVRAGHNPGDTFIGLGAQYVCEAAADRVLPWHILCRFGYDENVGDDHHRQRDFALRCLAQSDLAVYGGMPQYNDYSKWKFPYDDELWRDVINPSGARVIVLAGGSGEPDPTKPPEQWARECAADSETVRIIKQRTESGVLFTVRDRYAKALLDELGIESHLLPCTAVFAGSQAYGSRVAEEGGGWDGKKMLIVPQSIGRDDRETARFWVDIARRFDGYGYDVTIVCHQPSDRDAIEAVAGDGAPVFYADDYATLLRFYRRNAGAGLISGRLHSTLVAWGLGAQYIVNVTIDSRGYAVEEVGKANPDATIENVVKTPDLRPSHIIDRYMALDKEGDMMRKIDLQGIEEEYTKLLRPFFTEGK